MEINQSKVFLGQKYLQIYHEGQRTKLRWMAWENAKLLTCDPVWRCMNKSMAWHRCIKNELVLCEYGGC